MDNDDSFNDSDEVLNIYSSKKVTENFKAQLKNLLSKNQNFKIGSRGVILPESYNNGKEKEKAEPCRERISTVLQEETSVAEESPSFNTNSDCSLDGEIKILEEKAPKKRRRSERLRRKNGETENRMSETIVVCSDIETPIRRVPYTKESGRKRGRKPKTKKVISEIVLDDSPLPPENLEDEINPEVSVKVIWKSINIKKFQIRKFQKLSKIFELISTEESIPEDKIMLTFNGVRVCRTDTPDSLNLQVYHFLDGGVLSDLTNSCAPSNPQISESDDNNSVTLKFQDSNKKIVILKLNRDDKMKVAMIKYSEQLEIPLANIRFYFDGDVLEPSETPTSLGLENDEIIDIKIKD